MRVAPTVVGLFSATFPLKVVTPENVASFVTAVIVLIVVVPPVKVTVPVLKVAVAPLKVKGFVTTVFVLIVVVPPVKFVIP